MDKGTHDLDRLMDLILSRRFHNHRREDHSNDLSDLIVNRLKLQCDCIREDFDAGHIKYWKNVGLPNVDYRGRRLDFLIGPPDANGEPNLDSIRIAGEHKSVVTAHRNVSSRHDDLDAFAQSVHRRNAGTILVGSVLLGTSQRYLNVADRVKPSCKDREIDFSTTVLPRLSTGDATLWTDFPSAISTNKPGAPSKTLEVFNKLRIRQSAASHLPALDFLLIVPVVVDNVDPPGIASPTVVGIDAYLEYDKLIQHLCQTYVFRWHPSRALLR